MCFSTPKVPDAPKPLPPPDPAPIPTPAETSPESAEESRRKRLERLRTGLVSTVKTSRRGMFGIENALKSSSSFAGGAYA